MIEGKGLLGFIYKVMEWVTRIAYVNILWSLFTVLGLVVAGIAPATVSIFTITRKWVKGNTDDKIFPVFWNTYKAEFVKSNLLLWPLLIAGYILFIDYQYIMFLEGPLFFLSMMVFVNIAIMYLITVLYIFPTYVHFEFKNIFQYYKNAFMMGFSTPFITIFMFVSLLIIGLAMERIPGLIPFFLVTTFSLVLMWYAHRSFIKTEKRAA